MTKKEIKMDWDKLADQLLSASQMKNIYSNDVRDMFKGLAMSIDYATDRYLRENKS